MTAERPVFPSSPTGEDGVPVDWTDLGVGEALTSHFLGRWVRDMDRDLWHEWDGNRWAAQPDDKVHADVQEWVTDVGLRIVGRPGDVSGLLKSYSALRRVGSLERATTSARRRVLVHAADFDRHPHLLAARNGVVDLRTGELSPPDPDLMLSKVAGCDYVAGARHPDVDQLLTCVDDDVRDSLQMAFGAAATGYPTDDVVVLDGPGANGKTLLLSTVARALGDHAVAASPDLVVQGDGGPPGVVWVAELRGARLAYLEELAEDHRLRVERTKAITGGGRLLGARKYGQPFEFDPTHSLFVATNYRPLVNDAGRAIWRRLKLVPFPYCYVPAGTPKRPGDRDADVGLRERLRRPDRLEAMLSWLVDGAIYALEAGDLLRPEVDWCSTVLDATKEWRDGEDVVGRFLADCVEVTGRPEDEIRGLDLFDAYADWCAAERRPPGQAKTFYARFLAHDDVAARVLPTRPQGSVYFQGVRRRGAL